MQKREWTPARVAGASVLVVVLAAALIRGALLLGNLVFGAAEQDVSRLAFKSSRSYVDGTLGMLYQYRVEYEDPKTTREHKKAIRALVLHECASFPQSQLTSELRSWVAALRSTKETP